MNRRALILVFVLLLSLLAGCGTTQETPETTSPAVFVTIPAAKDSPVEVNTANMTHYDLECGFSFFGPGNLKEQKTEAMAAYMDSGFFLVMVIEEPKAGTAVENMTAQEYADLLTSQNNLTPCTTDRYGNLATCYAADSITGEKDFRIPYTQSLEAFTAARTLGIPARLVAFENEAHQVFKPQNSLVWNREFFGWLDKYVK